MHSTPPTLIQRLQQHNDHAAWTRFVHLYSPLLFEWVRRLGVSAGDAPDLVQNVLLKLLQGIRLYQARPNAVGSFRSWLFIVVRNCLQDQGRANRRQFPLADPDRLAEISDSDPLIAWTDKEYRQYLMRRVVDLIRADYPEATWRAFQGYVLEGRTAEEVAREVGTTPNAVYLVRGRLLRRIRDELAGLLD